MKKIALAQVNPVVGNIEKNCEAIVQSIEQARGGNAEVVVFPQFSLCGVPVHDLLFHEEFMDELEKALRKICSKTKGLLVIVGTIYKDLNRIHDGAVVFHDGNEFGRQDGSLRMWNVDEFRFGLMVGENHPSEFPSTPDMLFHLVASSWDLEIEQTRMKWAHEFVAHCASPYLFVNLVGGNDEWVFDGRGFLLSSEGRVLFQTKPYTTETFFVEEIEEIVHLSQVEDLFLALCCGIRDFVRKSNKKKALVGVSGGIDSAVVASLAVEALGKDCVELVFLPSKVTSEESIVDVQELSHCLDLPLITVPLSPYVEQFPLRCEREVTQDNLQARLRGVILMSLCNEKDSLLLATGNRSEMMVGYVTLYGDLSGALLPLGDLFKEKIYDLASYLNVKGKCIPQRMLTKGPSAELHVGQLDTDLLPPYPILDAILQNIFIEGRLIEETALMLNVHRDLVVQVANMVLQSEYKRRQAPPILKVVVPITERLPINDGFRFR
jgi:NAD+ synthase (glutamine-hydrolysing)